MAFIRQETSAYRLERDRFGFYELTRKSDGASAFFQGDDADLWNRNMDALERCHRDDEPRLVSTFDFLCSGYDDVLAA